MGVNLIIRQLEKATMLLCLSFRIIQQNKRNGSNYQIKTSKLQKHPGLARPEVRGTAEPHGGAYPPCSTPPSYVVTFIILTTLRTNRQRPIVKFLTDADAFADHFRCSLKPRECYSRGHLRPALSSQDELLPARLVIHRQTSGHARRSVR